MLRLAAHVNGIGIIGPGLKGWSSSAAILRGLSPYVHEVTELPTPECLPPTERRRLGRVVKLAIGVGLQATANADTDASRLPAVFASSGGDGHNCHEICQALSAHERLISPIRFHNSVHNAAAGYWSIATGSKVSSNSLCAFDASFAAGLLEAITWVAVDRAPVLLVAYDAQYPPPLSSKRPIPDAFGMAFVLSPAPSATSVGFLALSVVDGPVQTMADVELERLRATIPAARSLPLLRQLAMREAGTVNIEYLGAQCVAMDVTPCN